MYKPLDYWMICQRCGGKFRKSRMKQEWTGLWVCERGCFETQHSQDSVEGIEDIQTVDISRPDIAQVMGQTTLDGALSQWDTAITLISASGLEDEDPIGIELDNGVIHWSFLTADPVGNTIAINDGVPFAAASGNAVYKPSQDNETWA